MKRIICNIFLLSVFLMVATPVAASEVERALQDGSKALLGDDMDRAISAFSSAMEVGDPTREQLVTAHSGLCASRYKKSMILKDPNLTRKAITDCDMAITLKADYQSVYRMRGIAYLTLGILDRAIEDLNIAVALAPDDYLAVQNRGLAKAKLGHSKAAISDFDRSIQLKPGHPWGYYNRGRLYAAGHLHEKAVADFTTFTRFKTGFEPIYLHRGRSQMYLGRYQQAVGDFREAVRLRNGKNPVALSNLGIALYLMGNYKEALDDFEKVKTMVPDNVENKIWLYLVRERMEKPVDNLFSSADTQLGDKTWPGAMVAYLLGHNEAHSVLKVVGKTQDPAKRGERESLAMFLFGERAKVWGQEDQAKKWFQSVVNKPGSPSIWYHAAGRQLHSSNPATTAQNFQQSAPYATQPKGVYSIVQKPSVQSRPTPVRQQIAPQQNRGTQSGIYVFKVASFKSMENADQALIKLTEMGYGVFLREVMVNGSRYLRVWVGPFSSEREANIARNQIKMIPGYHPSKVQLR